MKESALSIIEGAFVATFPAAGIAALGDPSSPASPPEGIEAPADSPPPPIPNLEPTA
jgi:hypothetical protein